MQYDVVIVGAGAAGLAAGRALSGAGRSTLILEARPRLGGRVFSQQLPSLPVPLELGAETVLVAGVGWAVASAPSALGTDDGVADVGPPGDRSRGLFGPASRPTRRAGSA